MAEDLNPHAIARAQFDMAVGYLEDGADPAGMKCVFLGNRGAGTGHSGDHWPSAGSHPDHHLQQSLPLALGEELEFAAQHRKDQPMRTSPDAELHLALQTVDIQRPVGAHWGLEHREYSLK